MSFFDRVTVWIKANKLASVLLLIFCYFVFRGFFANFAFNTIGNTKSMYQQSYVAPAPGSQVTSDVIMGSRGSGIGVYTPQNEAAPTPQIKDRKVQTESNMSVVVKDFEPAVSTIKNEVTSLGGYVVSTDLNTPQGISTGYVVARVPADKMDAFLAFVRKSVYRITYSHISGTDVTDQYVDIQARLATLNKTKAKYEEFFNKATNVNDLINIQNYILQVQGQIEQLQGQLKYMDATTSTSLITINLSTDEYSLPYAPEQPWSPSIIFKLAIRSLIGTLRGLGSLAIWIAVYSVIWVPALALVLIIRRRRRIPKV